MLSGKRHTWSPLSSPASINFDDNLDRVLDREIDVYIEATGNPIVGTIHAKKIIDQFNKSDTGLVVIDGKLIEKPVLREMQRKILVADKINKS